MRAVSGNVREMVYNREGEDNTRDAFALGK
jgi:hypothetical protein